MKSRAASAAAMAASSAESVQSISTASSHSEETLSESQPDEAGSTSRKVKPKNCKQATGTLSHKATRLTPSPDDPDINALYEARIHESDGQRVFKCKECEMVFTRPYDARRHANVHLAAKKVTCAICKERLSGPLSYDIHHKEKHKGQRKAVLGNKNDEKGSSQITRKSSMAEISSKNNSPTSHPDPSTETVKSKKLDSLNRRLTRSKAAEESIIEDSMKEDSERNIKRKKSDDTTMEEAMKDFEKTIKRKKEGDSSVVIGDSIEATKKEDVLEIDMSQENNESVAMSSESNMNAESVFEVAKMDELVQPAKSEISIESVIVSSKSIKNEESVIEVARKKYDEMTIENQGKGDGKEDSDDIVVISPISDDKTKMRESTVHVERRSTRIQMKRAMEESAMEDEKRGIIIRTPPIYPSNNEKMKDLQMDLRAMCRRDTPMPPPASDSNVASTKRAISKRPSRASSNSVRGSSSRESIVTIHDTSVSNITMPPPRPFVDLTSAGGASTISSFHGLTSPLVRPRSSFALQTPPSTTPVATPPQTSYPPLAVKYGPGVASYLVNGIGSNHYPRLGGLYGPQVHKHQPTVTVNRNFLYPAALSATLLRTIYHPAWFRPRHIGADEMYAMTLYGHSHLILPVRMRKTGTLMERCLKALGETAMPLPPLQPLLPSPCPLLHDMYSDPLDDVLPSYPILPSKPSPFATLSMNTVPEPKYVAACEGARFQPWSKSEDRRWWEVRTFPSFHSLNLSNPGYPIPSSGRSNTMIYSMADKNTKRHAMKYTYVTSKKPVFSVLIPQWPSSSSSLEMHPSHVNPFSSYTMPPSDYPTPSNTPAASGNYGIEQCQGSRAVSSRRPDTPSAIAAATRALSWSLPLKKRKAPEEARPLRGSEVEALVKRIKTSINDSFPGHAQQQLQQLEQPPRVEMIMRQPDHQMMRPPEESYANSMQLQSHYNDQEPLIQRKIKVEQDGTTFTVL